MSQSSTSANKQKAYIIASVLFAILSFTFLFLYFQSRGEHKLQLSATEELNRELEALALDKSTLETLKKIDEKTLETGNYRESIEAYKQLLSTAPPHYVNDIELRIQQLTSMLEDIENTNEQSSRKDLIIAQNRKHINELQGKIDSLQREVALAGEANLNEIVRLKEELAIQENKLNRKETVQVISFPGTKGAKIHYLGEVKDGKANGGGIGIWTTGSVYKGNWKDNLRHGKGTYEWADGQKYDGEYQNGKRDGFGSYLWPSGERYEGDWKNDRRNGKGVFYDPDGNIKFDGIWEDDKPLK